MNAPALSAGRERLGLTVQQFAAALGMSADDLADMEAGRRPVSGPVAMAAQALFDGWRPPHMRAGRALAFAA